MSSFSGVSSVSNSASSGIKKPMVAPLMAVVFLFVFEIPISQNPRPSRQRKGSHHDTVLSEIWGGRYGLYPLEVQFHLRYQRPLSALSPTKTTDVETGSVRQVAQFHLGKCSNRCSSVVLRIPQVGREVRKMIDTFGMIEQA